MKYLGAAQWIADAVVGEVLLDGVGEGDPVAQEAAHQTIERYSAIQLAKDSSH